MKEYTNSQIIALVDEYIHKDRDRDILKDRLVNGMCYEPLAEKYCLSVQRVRDIVYKSQTKLFKHL